MTVADGRAIGLLGIPFDANSSHRRGPRKAPRAIRAAMGSEAGNAWSERGIEVWPSARVVDHGDLRVSPRAASRKPIEQIERGVAKVLAVTPRLVVLGGDHAVTAPVSLIVSAFAPVDDVRATLTPLLRTGKGPTSLVLLDAGDCHHRLGASALAQVYGQLGDEAPDVDAERLAALFAVVQQARRDALLLAYHDVGDGGLFATLVEMAFASRCGLEIMLDGIDAPPLAALFAEEIGAVVQVDAAHTQVVIDMARSAGLHACVVAAPSSGDRVRVRTIDHVLLDEARVDLHRAWSATTHEMQRLRDNPLLADQEYERLADAGEPPMPVHVGFNAAEDIAAPFVATGVRPPVAILREQGVNGHVEMAAAFDRAGFAAIDIHMSDIIAGRRALAEVQGVVACGGFSYGDVLGAGEGWAKSILFNARARDEFAAFFARPDTFALGVCNGCQMMSQLHDLIPGAAAWPRFERNLSEQFEARFARVEVLDSPSLFFADMAGSMMPIVVSHGEGRVVFRDPGHAARALSTLRYVDHRGAPTDTYPMNPNGSVGGQTGFTTPDGRFSILMPHPERVFRAAQLSWKPHDMTGAGPWLRMFRNARRAVG